MVTGFNSELMPSEYREMVALMAGTKNMATLISFELLYDETIISKEEAETKLTEFVALWRDGWGNEDWSNGIEGDPIATPVQSYLTEVEMDCELLHDRGFIICLEMEYAVPLDLIVQTMIKHIPEQIDVIPYDKPEVEQEITERGEAIADPQLTEDILRGRYRRIELPEE